MVDNYEKGEVRELDTDFIPFGSEFANTIVMRVKIGSKLHSLVGFAEKQLEAESCRHIIFAGMGPACTKTISAVEVLKRRLRFGLYQITKSRFKRIEEYWDPKTVGLERLKVNRDIPAIYILLSKDVLSTDDAGYQGPGHDIPLLQSERPVYRRQQQQQARNRPGADNKDGNKWRRPGKREMREKKQHSKSYHNASASGNAESQAQDNEQR